MFEGRKQICGCVNKRLGAEASVMEVQAKVAGLQGSFPKLVGAKDNLLRA